MSQKKLSAKITIDVEICSSCKSHQWCTRHDEKKYQTIFEQVKAAIQKKDSTVQVEKHLVGGSKIGAFEISSNGFLLYSKLSSGYFPFTAAVTQKIMNFVKDSRDNKDVKPYDIRSEEAQMRKSNQKYYDKLNKSIAVEKSPKKDQKYNVAKVQKKNDEKTQNHQQDKKKQTSKQESPTTKDSKIKASHNVDQKNMKNNHDQKHKKEEKKEHQIKKEQKKNTSQNVAAIPKVQQQKKEENSSKQTLQNKQQRVDQAKNDAQQQQKKQNKAEVPEQKKIETVQKVNIQDLAEKKWVSKCVSGQYQTNQS